MELSLQFSVGKLSRFVGVLIWRGKKNSKQDRSTGNQFAQGKMLFLQVKNLIKNSVHLQIKTVLSVKYDIFTQNFF